jgi:L-asparaginase
MTSKKLQNITVLGMGGTIAGLAGDPNNPKEYVAGELGIADLIKDVSHVNEFKLDVLNVAQINSKDMRVGHWQALLSAVQTAMGQTHTHAVVITHGTDTLEETAYLLQAMGPWPKPLVLTCAMLPANAPDADGPGNLKHALSWALHSTTGVFVVCAGKVHASHDVQKITTESVDAFTSGPQGCWATWVDGQWQVQARPDVPTQSEPRPSLAYALAAASWPRVEMVMNHALNDGAVVRALLANSGSEETPLAGIVLAGTGMGTASQALEKALQKAVDAGVRVWLSSRCIFGLAHAQANTHWGAITLLSAAKARTALCLSLLAEKERQS